MNEGSEGGNIQNISIICALKAIFIQVNSGHLEKFGFQSHYAIETHCHVRPDLSSNAQERQFLEVPFCKYYYFAYVGLILIPPPPSPSGEFWYV
jgi:hypothetical protein